MHRKRYRKWLIIVFIFYITAFLYYISYKIHIPLPGRWQPEAVQADVDISETEEKRVVPLGMPVGIYIKMRGVLVLGTGEVTTYTGERLRPAEQILCAGDYILEANGVEIQSTDTLTEILRKWKGGDLIMKVQRNEEILTLRMAPVQTADLEYKLGVWIRQDAQGIGTLSYVDSENHFGALGHGITDIDTSLRIDISGGRLYETRIFSIVKGKSGNPGEMVGNIDYKAGTIFGSIDANNEEGIFGTLEAEHPLYDESQALPVASKDEVERGAATIRCCVEGRIQDYSVEIESMDIAGFKDNRDMVIEISDPRLLNVTNGIVQGMSGSPILQNGKVVGVVTHVFVNDPTKGYGIFIENMMAAAE